MYQNIWCEKRGGNQVEVHLWDDTAGYQNFIFKNYAYIKDGSGQYRSIYGDKLKKVTYWTEEDYSSGKVFESDVPLETKILLDRYHKSDESSKNHVELFFDIEVEVIDGFPEPTKANNKITSIALYNKMEDCNKVFIISDKIKSYTNGNTIVEVFGTEQQLLQAFLKYWINTKPTIISGWNINKFDIPYLYNRITKVFGEEFASALSPIQIVKYNTNKQVYRIAGVSSLDYLELYKKFTYTQQSSYRLDHIGKIEVNIGKVEYDGSLDDLYRDDIDRFIEYNLNDVKIVVALDDKLKLIDLARAVSHLGRIPYEEVYYSSRYIEGAILVYLKQLNLVTPNKKAGVTYDGSYGRFSGAYVKSPVPGRYDWVFDLDLTSMYPSIIMSLNISPETKIGKINGWDAEEFIKGTTKTYSIEKEGKVIRHLSNGELKDFMNKNNVSISSNGVIYDLSKKGIILPESVHAGNVYGSLEARLAQSYDGTVNPIDMAVLIIGKFIKEEEPFFSLHRKQQKDFVEDLTNPDDEDSTDLGEVPHEEKKGSLRPGYIRGPYGMSSFYRI